MWKIISLQQKREREERTLTVTVIVMKGVTYPHEYACPDSEALCNRMVRINRRAKLPLKQNNKTRQDEMG